jgi:repressor LexA
VKPQSLTVRERRVLDFIREALAGKGYPPTLREICAHFGWSSTNAAATHLGELQRKGYIEIERHKSRGLRLVGPSEDDQLTDGIRRIGSALGVDLGAAGEPLPADWLRRCIEAAQTRRAA